MYVTSQFNMCMQLNELYIMILQYISVWH